jgi:hypothetical protein
MPNILLNIPSAQSRKYITCVCLCMCVCVRTKSKTFLLTHSSIQLMVTVNQTPIWIDFYFPVDKHNLLCTNHGCMSIFMSLLTAAQGISCIAFALTPVSCHRKCRSVTFPVKSTTTLALSFKEV